MTQEQRDVIYNTFLNDIKAHKKLPIDEYVSVEDFLLSVREQNPKAVDIALKCVEYVNRITNYGFFGKYHT